MTLEEKFKRRLIDSIARHDLAGTIRAQQDLENLKSTGFNKRVSVKAIVDELDKEDRNRVLRSLNRIPIMADILESLLVDFLDELERIDNTIVMQNITPRRYQHQEIGGEHQGIDEHRWRESSREIRGVVRQGQAGYRQRV